jgi:hypothetical protein
MVTDNNRDFINAAIETESKLRVADREYLALQIGHETEMRLAHQAATATGFAAFEKTLDAHLSMLNGEREASLKDRGEFYRIDVQERDSRAVGEAIGKLDDRIKLLELANVPAKPMDPNMQGLLKNRWTTQGVVLAVVAVVGWLTVLYSGIFNGKGTPTPIAVPFVQSAPAVAPILQPPARP